MPDQLLHFGACRTSSNRSLTNSLFNLTDFGVAKLLSIRCDQSFKTKIMRRVLFIAIIAFTSFSCNNSGSASQSSDTVSNGTDTINSLNGTGTGTGTGTDTMSGPGTGSKMDTAGRTGGTAGHDSTRR